MLSSYLDSAVSGAEMRGIGAHLEQCRECAAAYGSLRATQSLVAAAGRHQAPPQLALQLRVALSRERSMTPARRLQAYVMRLEHAVNSFMVPATAGVFSAIVVFGLLLGMFVPAELGATDVPTGLYTPPRLLASAIYSGVNTVQIESDSPVLVETYIDANGRVQDYRIISGEASASVRAELNRALIFTVFEPAMFFGKPAPGRLVISFSNINVKG